MRFEAGAGLPERFALRSPPDEIVLESQGFRHPLSKPSRGRVFTPYDEITHLAPSRRALWVGSRQSVYLLPRNAFERPEDADHLVRALIERIARLPGGDRQLARMASIEQRARSAPPARTTWVLAAACVLAYVLQLALGRVVEETCFFSTTLVQAGETWRLITSHLIHAAPSFPLHLMMNVLALVLLGTLVERPLGTLRTAEVVGESALGAAGASMWAGYEMAVGMSGVVYGLAGALIWLELRCNLWLPAGWRIPRRALYVLIVLNVGISFLPIIAGAAHAGGCVGGLLAAAAVSDSAMREERPARWARLAAALVGAFAFVSLASAGEQIFLEDDPLARSAERLALIPDVAPVRLNDTAWMLAIGPDPTPAQLRAALVLAERAVEGSGRADPNILDTLAEVQFVSGRSFEAIETIDEAIALTPDEPYFREQRRRFTGERAADDRPEPPGAPSFRERPLEPPPEPGLTV